jgi:hypothetical protein
VLAVRKISPVAQVWPIAAVHTFPQCKHGDSRVVTRIWEFVPWLPYDMDAAAFSKSREILNGWDVFNARQPMGTVWKDFPLVQLKISSDEFEVDCFGWEGYLFVSERLREAFALTFPAVQYLEVDCSQSSSSPISKRFKLMNVPVIEDTAFAYEMQPDHALFFHHSSPGSLFCTDAVAVRALRAGCVGVRFFDPAVARPGPRLRYRTLRGLEEGGWDPISKTGRSTLIEQMD